MRTVLIVDDNAEVLRSMRRLMAMSGWRVEEASTAPGAMSVLHRAHISVVVTDYFLERSENGAWLRERISEKFANVPVILTTGISSVDDDVRKRFDGVIVKPINGALLLRMMNSMTTNGGGAHV